MNMKEINTKKTAKYSGRFIAFQHTSERLLFGGSQNEFQNQGNQGSPLGKQNFSEQVENQTFFKPCICVYVYASCD